MHAAAILGDGDLVHEVFMAAPQRSRMFDDGEESSSGTDGATGGFINCPLPWDSETHWTAVQHAEGFPKCSGRNNITYYYYIIIV